jgi:hypothetical protein
MSVSLYGCWNGIATFAVVIPPLPGGIQFNVVLSSPAQPDTIHGLGYVSGGEYTEQETVGDGPTTVTWFYTDNYGGRAYVYSVTLTACVPT